MTMDASRKTNGHGLLSAVEDLLSTVFIPSLRKLDKGWGQLEKNPQIKMDFLNTLDSFVSVIVGELIPYFTLSVGCSILNRSSMEP